ncbi:MAG: hypothetical protein WCS72_14725 [Deltaproteobacteria bacterium]
MSDTKKLPTRNDSSSTSSWRDIRLDDCRRPEDQGSDRIATLPGIRGWLGLVLLVTATIALVTGLHLVAPATGTAPDMTAGAPHQHVTEAAASPAR